MKLESRSTQPIDALAEGSTGAVEDQEPAVPVKKTSLPTTDNDSELPRHAAETGLISVVNFQIEGQDDGEAQDASRPSEEVKSAPAPEKHLMKKRNESPTVLIIEDTVELAEIIEATLERMNIVTAHETHGVKAIDKFYEMNPDVVLLDISLPDIPGWKIMDAIKEHGDQTGWMPVIIIITAYDDPANRLVGKLQGVYSYLIKPFTADEIEKAVAQAISGTSG